MRSFAIFAAAAGIASAASSGWAAPVYVTDVVTAYTTYCPSATKITHGASTYTVTEATTLTITNCPCTITRPVSSTKASSAVVTSKAAASTGVSSKAAASASSTYTAPKISSSATSSAPVTSYTGAANKVQVAGGMLAALGLVAAAL